MLATNDAGSSKARQNRVRKTGIAPCPIFLLANDREQAKRKHDGL